MPLYFFVVPGILPTANEGFEFPDDNSARREAELMLPDLSKNWGPEGGLVVTVVDESGRKIAEVPPPWRPIKS
jgi:hypothetical protein